MDYDRTIFMAPAGCSLRLIGVDQMKKILPGLLIALIILSVLAVPALARTATVKQDVGPYEGTFDGYLVGSEDSRAPLKLILRHRDGVVYGWAKIGEGLQVSAGRCGEMRLPDATRFVKGESISGDAHRIAVETQFAVRGFEIDVDLESVLSQDGQMIQADTRIDIPWICGRDVVLQATLERVDRD